MKFLISFFGGWLAIAAFGMVPMMGIFAGAAGANEGHIVAGNVIMYSAFAVAVMIAALHIWGQVKYWKLAEGEKTRWALLLLFSYVPLTVFYFLGAVFLAQFVTE